MIKATASSKRQVDFSFAYWLVLLRFSALECEASPKLTIFACSGRGGVS
jgi:hypothetical protein